VPPLLRRHLRKGELPALRELVCVVDRFEEGNAVLLAETGEADLTIDWPAVLLPAGAREGDVIKICMEICRDETASRRRHVEDLLRRLQKGTNQP